MTEELIGRIDSLLAGAARPVVVAIDGPSASGKTTLAAQLGLHYACQTLHTDDFFLPLALRTPERLAEPGGNMDRHRLLSEVLEPMAAGLPLSYRVFDCRVMDFTRQVEVAPHPLYILEGAYSHHPELTPYYHLRVFLDIDKAAQHNRIETRNPVNGRDFFTRWIPMEDAYFAAFSIRERCDLLMVAELSGSKASYKEEEQL